MPGAIPPGPEPTGRPPGGREKGGGPVAGPGLGVKLVLVGGGTTDCGRGDVC
jgi:hypothetical protein